RIVAMPTTEEVRQWLEGLRKRRGLVKQLAARFILETGLRRGEEAALDVSQLPSREELTMLEGRDLRIAPMDLVKTKKKQPRTIQVPVELGWELRKWADTRRLTLCYRYKQRTGKSPSTALFLSDSPGFEGIPLKAQTIYKIFRGPDMPVANWSPHKARHAYACF